ncbi:MAG: 30S ribosomal protein S1 [Desulfobacterales bacterium]|nr:MAG: 30S ribosomal protein S1 [Desulfobacterales bacterium]
MDPEKTAEDRIFGESPPEGPAEVEIEDFASMFAAYSETLNDDIQLGDRVKGEIIKVGIDSVFISTGSKIDGAVDKSELMDENGDFPFNEGDSLELYVVGFSENEVRLSRAMSGQGGLDAIADAYHGEVPVEGTVKEQIKGGFQVEVMKQRAFCPVSQMDTRYVDMPEDYVGHTYQFLISRFEEKGRNIVVNRRELLAREQEAGRKEFLESVTAGDILEGRVTSIMPYGAFVELAPGVEGMCHISELSWSRVGNPRDVVSKGDTVTVQILDIKPGRQEGQVKISLSIRQAGGDPWTTVDTDFRVGDKVPGKVTRLAGFGAFVELVPGVEGLIHISEMSYTRRVNRPGDVVTPGQTVTIMIKDIDTGKRRISLSLRDAGDDPWTGVEDRYPVGAAVSGTVEKMERFGMFIQLEPGVTGLIPKSRLARAEKPGELEKLPPGAPVTVMVEEIQTEARKITLSPADMKDEDDWRKYAGGRNREKGAGKPAGDVRNKSRDSSGNAVSGVSFGGSSSGGLGSMAEALQKAMAGKK